jgi:hypothetical protein
MHTLTMTPAWPDEAAAPWLWTLDTGRARRLRAAPVARWLWVREGRVWLTRSQRTPEPPGEDIWLAPGQRLLLPAGSEWVAEGWPAARVLVLQAP